METEWEGSFRAPFENGELDIFDKSVEPDVESPYINFQYNFWEYVMVEHISLDASEQDFDNFLILMKEHKIEWYKSAFQRERGSVSKYAIIGCLNPVEAERLVNHIDGVCYFGYRMQARILGKRFYRMHQLESRDDTHNEASYPPKLIFKGLPGDVYPGILNRCLCFGKVRFYEANETTIPNKYNLDVYFENVYASYAAEMILNGCFHDDTLIVISAGRNGRVKSLIEKSMYDNWSL